MNRKKERITFLGIDIGLIICVLVLIILGIAFIYSSGVISGGQQVSDEWIRQIIWAASGLILMIVFALIDYRRLRSLALPLYIGLLTVLILVLMVGSYVKGARAWLGIGGIGIQPSEFGKLILIIMLAWWFDARVGGTSNFRQGLGAVIITGIPTFLILLQPDLGTAIVSVPILFTIAFFSGMNWKYLFYPAITGGIIIFGVLGFAWSTYIAQYPLSFFRLFTNDSFILIILPAMLALLFLVFLGWVIFRRPYFLGVLYGFGILTTAYLGVVASIRALRGYQMMRFVVFLDPQIDPRGAGWQIIQSVTAVGSGGVTGKGFLQGTQSHYRYLPEQSTDFIFSIIAEEMGFLGGVIIFALFSIILIRCCYIAYTAQDRFGTYIAVGIASMISFHVIENIGMAIGVMPITGIPLYFLSYGGSSLWTVLISMGVLLSIHIRRNPGIKK